MHGVLHIPGLTRNLIYVRKMDDARVKTIFEKETCRMVRGEMVLLKGVHFGTLYMLKGSTISDGSGNMPHFCLVFYVASIYVSIVGQFSTHGFFRWFSISI